MKKINSPFFILPLIVILSFFINSVSVNAQTSKPIPTSDIKVIPEEINQIDQLPNTVNCFDYYKFGSIKVDMQSASSIISAGSPISVKTIIKNTNDYPIVDGLLYIKVYKINTSNKGNGNDLVDQFIAKDNINLDANGFINTKFDWNIPSYSVSGDYRIASYFISQEKFNLLGLSFTDDVMGNYIEFKIKGEQKNGIYFDKSQVKVASSSYKFLAFTPSLDSKISVPINAVLINDSSEIRDTTVTIKTYSWDGISRENLLSTEKQYLSLKAKSSNPVKVNIKDTNHSVYYVVIEADTRGQKSIIGVRFNRQGIDSPRINFPSIIRYPLMKNQSNSVFSCVHNAGTSDVVQNNKMTLNVQDMSGKDISTYTYTGDITGAMMAVKNDFTPKKDYSSFQIVTEIYHNNRLIDKNTTVYDCKKLNPTLCKGDEGGIGGGDTTDLLVNKNIMYLVITITLLILAILIILKIKNKSHQVIVLFVLFGLTAFIPNKTFAASKTVMTTINNPSLSYYEYPGSKLGLSASTVNVNYSADAIDKATNSSIVDGSNILVGTKIRFTSAKGDISWFGTGYAADTPVGKWIADAKAEWFGPVTDNSTQILSDNCSAANGDFNRIYSYIITNVNGGITTVWNMVKVIYIPFSVNPPIVNFNHSANLTCSAISPDTQDCTVNAAGPITASFDFAPTYGFFYHRYEAIPDEESKGQQEQGCYGNTRPMGRSVGGVYTPYQVPVPAQSISYSFNGVNPPPVNLPCTVPSINTPPVVGVVNTDYPIRAVSTDPESDNVSYGFDWNADGIVDNWAPSSGFVTSGTSQSINHRWTTGGVKTIKVLCKDEKSGVLSNWGTANFQVANPPNSPPTVPVLTGPSVGEMNKVYTFNAVSTDPDMDFVKYGFDWNNDSVVDEWMPAGGYVPNGLPGQNNSNLISLWTTPGNKSFQVKAMDSKGASSYWSTYHIDISAAANNPPVATITGPVDPISHNPLTGPFLINKVYTFAVKCDDPDGDDTSCEIDWKGDGITDLVQPATGYSSTGNVFYVSNNSGEWPSPISYTIKVRGKDSKGLVGAWTSKTITVTNPGPGSTLTLNFSASPSLILTGNKSTLQWSVTGATSCNGTDGTASWVGSKDSSDFTTHTELTDVFNDTTLTDHKYTLTCTGSGDTISAQTTVRVAVLKMWLNDNTNTTKIKLRAGDKAIVNWQDATLTSCHGVKVKEPVGGTLGDISSYGNLGSGNAPITRVITPALTKGIYDIKISCNEGDSNTVEIVVTDAKLEEI